MKIEIQQFDSTVRPPNSLWKDASDSLFLSVHSALGAGRGLDQTPGLLCIRASTPCDEVGRVYYDEYRFAGTLVCVGQLVVKP